MPAPPPTRAHSPGCLAHGPHQVCWLQRPPSLAEKLNEVERLSRSRETLRPDFFARKASAGPANAVLLLIASAVFASRIQRHLDRYGVSLPDLVWQTVNASEFKGDVLKALGDSQHVRMPPAAHTYQSDVETAHPLEEEESFDLEDLSRRGDFLTKVQTY